MRASCVNADSLARGRQALDLGAYLRLGKGEEQLGRAGPGSLLATPLRRWPPPCT